MGTCITSAMLMPVVVPDLCCRSLSILHPSPTVMAPGKALSGQVAASQEAICMRMCAPLLTFSMQVCLQQVHDASKPAELARRLLPARGLVPGEIGRPPGRPQAPRRPAGQRANEGLHPVITDYPGAPQDMPICNMVLCPGKVTDLTLPSCVLGELHVKCRRAISSRASTRMATE